MTVNTDTGLTKIGKGMFTTAYLKPDGKVLLKSKDRVKLAMSEGAFPEHRIFPTITLEDVGAKYKYFSMKYYKPVSSIKRNITPRQWRFYTALRNMGRPKTSGEYRSNEYIKMFEKLPSEFRKEKDALIDAMSGLSNYTPNVGFEISPRNVAVHGGKLILLDCFYFIDDMC